MEKAPNEERHVEGQLGERVNGPFLGVDLLYNLKATVNLALKGNSLGCPSRPRSASQ
jgi:hypothetical protein